MRVYLTEKHSQQKAIAAVLGRPTKGQRPLPGTIAAGDGLVATASGHLVGTPLPDQLRPEWEKFSIEHLPILPTEREWRKRPLERGAKLLKDTAAALKAATLIVKCTDAGREGEVIADELIEYAGATQTPTLRLWTSVVNPKGLQKAMDNLLPGKAKAGLGLSGKVRERTDYLEGINYSRIAALRRTEREGPPVSVGRTQSPTLALLVRTEEAIRNFKPTSYWTLTGTATDAKGQRVTLEHTPDPRLEALEAAQERCTQCTGATGALKVERKEKRQGPPKPFDLAAVQKLAGQRWGWSAQATLDVAQRLYDGAKAISYPRTDGEGFDPSEWDHCMAALANLHAIGHPATEHAPRPQSDGPAPLRRPGVFNEKVLEGKDHHAIMPTSEAPKDLSGDDALLFDLIARRFCAQFAGDWRFAETVMTFNAGEQGHRFRTSGRMTLDPGWRAIDRPEKPKTTKAPAKQAQKADDDEGDEDKEDEGKDKTLPALDNGTEVTLAKVALRRRATKPPPRFSEGSLIAELKRCKIGTKATWASIIETLKKRFFVTVKGKKKHIVPTARGKTLIAWLSPSCPEIVSIEYTAALETTLEAIEHGKGPPWQEVMQKVEVEMAQRLERMKTAPDLNLPAAEGWKPPKRQGRGGQGMPAPQKGFSFSRSPNGAWEIRAVVSPSEAKRLKAGTIVTVRKKDGEEREVTLGAPSGPPTTMGDTVVQRFAVAQEGNRERPTPPKTKARAPARTTKKTRRKAGARR